MNYEQLTQVSERQDRGEVFTPITLVEEMLDKLPKEVFESKTTTFLDPCFGTGAFLKAIGLRLKSAGHSSENINSRLFGFEIDSRLFNETKRKFNGISIYKEDFLNADINMKFDVIIGNPPYQGDQSGGNKTHSLWKKFIKKSTELAKCVLFVTPDTWICDDKVQRESFNKGTLKYAKLLPKNTFKQGKVSISTSYWIWTSEVNFNNSILDLLDGTSISFNNSLKDIPTSVINPLTISIHRKFLSLPSIDTTQSPIYYAYKNKSKVNKYPIYNTTAQGLCWSDRQPIDANVSKIMFSNVGAYKCVYDSGIMGTCWHSHAFEINQEFSSNALEYMNSKAIRFFDMINRSGGFMNGTFCKNIPIIDFSSSVDDQAVYNILGLTQEEIDYIENAVK